MQNFGGKQGLSIIGDVQMAKTRALCIITGFKDLETDTRKNSAVMACASGANYCKWGQGGGVGWGRGGRLYNIPAEGGGNFTVLA